MMDVGHSMTNRFEPNNALAGEFSAIASLDFDLRHTIRNTAVVGADELKTARTQWLHD
jgi:hypothetical protein